MTQIKSPRKRTAQPNRRQPRSTVPRGRWTALALSGAHLVLQPSHAAISAYIDSGVISPLLSRGAVANFDWDASQISRPAHPGDPSLSHYVECSGHTYNSQVSPQCSDEVRKGPEAQGGTLQPHSKWRNFVTEAVERWTQSTEDFKKDNQILARQI